MAQAAIFTTFSAPAETVARPTLFSRIIAAMVESRLRAANRELRARAFLLDAPLDPLSGMPLQAPVDRADLPFNR